VVNISDTKYTVVKSVANTLQWRTSRDTDDENWDVLWTDSYVPPERLARMKLYQKINHFVGMSALSRKNNLARNIAKLARTFPNDFNFHPRTWLIPSEINAFRQHCA
jgi:tubulin polyglutamylase TTLL6/13